MQTNSWIVIITYKLSDVFAEILFNIIVEITLHRELNLDLRKSGIFGNARAQVVYTTYTN